MLRGIAMLLVALFGFAPISPLVLASDADSRLPACCRRSGKHSCAMTASQPASSSGQTLQAARCRFFPPTQAVPPGRTVSLRGVSGAIFGGLVSRPASRCRTEAVYGYSTAAPVKAEPLLTPCHKAESGLHVAPVKNRRAACQAAPHWARHSGGNQDGGISSDNYYKTCWIHLCFFSSGTSRDLGRSFRHVTRRGSRSRPSPGSGSGGSSEVPQLGLRPEPHGGCRWRLRSDCAASRSVPCDGTQGWLRTGGAGSRDCVGRRPRSPFPT